MTPSLQGRHILIVGGTAGIGKAAARMLAERGANVVLLGRDPARAQAAVAELRKATGKSGISALVCDLSSREDVRRAAAQYRSEHPQLDVLINGAGMFLPKRELTPDGLEMSFASLFLGQFLLTELLLDSIKAAPQGRIICVTAPPSMAKLDFDNLQVEKGYATLKAVNQAKAALLAYMLDLVPRLEGSKVTANSVVPGYMIKTELHRNMPWYFRKMISLFGITPEQAAEAYVWMATAPELEKVTGRHFHLLKEKPITGQATDAAVRQRVMEIARKLAAP